MEEFTILVDGIPSTIYRADSITHGIDLIRKMIKPSSWQKFVIWSSYGYSVSIKQQYGY